MQNEMPPLPDAPFERPPLPENLEAEQAVIGSVFLEQETMDLIADKIHGHEFASSSHRKIFDVLAELHEEGASIDIVTVMNRLREKDWLTAVGGAPYLANIAGSVPSAARVQEYAEIVRDVALLRKTILDTRELLEELEHTHDPAAAIAKVQSTTEALTNSASTKKELRPAGEIAMDCFEEVEEKYFAHKDGRKVTGVESGFSDLDHLTSGFQKQDLVIVAARPSVGKTAFALNIAQNANEAVVAVFSLEMSDRQLVNRMMCAAGNIDSTRFRNGALYGDDWIRVSNAIGSISNSKIYIDDTPAITVAEIRAKCRRQKRENGLDLVIIDYIQLISGRGKRENRQQEVSEISRNLKQLARELDVPVIALSQLSRGVEQRQDKRPMMSDLRESGALEQDADIVAFLYREDYYDKQTENKNIIEIIIAKQRNGPVGTVELVFLKQFNKFVSIDREYGQEDMVATGTEGYKKPDMYRQ